MDIPLLSNAVMLSNQSFQQALSIGKHQNVLVNQGRIQASTSYQDFSAFIQQLLTGEGLFLDLSEEIASFASSLIHDGFLSVSKKILKEHILNAIITQSAETACWKNNQFYPICQTSELNKSGDYVTAEIFGESVFAVLNEKQQIKVFYNICPHRYNRLLTGKGNITKQGIRCNYHGWRFDLNGNCRFVPLSKTFGSDFCQSNHSLEELEARVEQSNVYVCPAQLSSTSAITEHFRHNNATELAEQIESALPKRIDLWQFPLPEPIRISIRLGYLESELRRTGTHIARQQKFDLKELLDFSPDCKHGEFYALDSERRQLLLALNKIRSKWSLADSNIRILAQHNDVILPTFLPSSLTSNNTTNAPQKMQATEETWEALPLWVYDDPELYALEIENIIKPVWQFVCHECEIPNSGDQCQLHIVGELITVSRQLNGELLAEWTIETNDSQAGKRKTIDLDNWKGFIFIRISSTDGPSMQDFWDKKEGLFTPYFKNITPLKEESWYDIAIPTNYKVVWENYLEVYHFPFVHKGRHRLCKPNLDSPFWPLRRNLSGLATDYEREYHSCIFSNGEHSLEYESQLIAQAERTRKLDKRLNYTLFGASPNQNVGPVLFGFTCFPEHVNVNSIIPTGPNECYLRSRCYQFPIDKNSQRGKNLLRAQQINTKILLQCITEEDIVLNLRCKSVADSHQFKRTGVLSREEDAIMYFQDYLRETLPVTRLRQRPSRGVVKSVNDFILGFKL